MLKNRDITLRIGKKINEETENGEIVNDEPLEEKVRRIVHALEEPAKKIFFGICLYVMVDTIRKVAIAKAENPER